MTAWTKEQRLESAASVKKMLRALDRHGPLFAGDLGAIVGLSGHVAGQRLKTAVTAGKVIICRRHGLNGETLYALPGQPIPPRAQPPTDEDRRKKAAIDADHAAWFASLPLQNGRQRVISTMRARV